MSKKEEKQKAKQSFFIREVRRLSKKDIREKEEEEGRKLNRKEKDKIVKRNGLKVSGKIAGIALMGALAIGGAAKAVKTLTAGNQTRIENENKKAQNTESQNKEENIIKTDKKQESKSEQTPEEKRKSFMKENSAVTYNNVIENMVKQYNEQYGTNLSANDITYIKSHPQFLAMDNNGNYIQDYRQSEQYQNYLTDLNKNNVDIYTFINKKDDKIVASVGKIYNKIENVDTKVVMNAQGKEYTESDKKLNIIDGKDREETQKIFDALEIKDGQKEQGENQEEKGLDR